VLVSEVQLPDYVHTSTTNWRTLFKDKCKLSIEPVDSDDGKQKSAKKDTQRHAQRNRDEHTCGTMPKIVEIQ